MSNPQSPFVVTQLTPVNPNGTPNVTYELSKASVSPERVIGRGPLGPIMDTLPTVYWKPFLMLDGGINKVPLRTGSVYSEHAEAKAYELETVTEIVRAGCIPAWLCPYSQGSEFGYLLGGRPFVDPPAGERDCGGSTKEGGCEHLQAISKLRKDEVLRKFKAEEALLANKRKEELQELQESLVEGLGAALRDNKIEQQE